MSDDPSAMQARPHLVLRIPQAYGVLAMVGLVGVIVLAYWLGIYNGRKTGHTAGYEQSQREFEARRQTNRRIRSVIGLGRAPSHEASTPVMDDDPFADPRQPGLNYYVVARYTREEALRTRRFLKGHGVASFVQQDQNTPFHEVVASRGFEKMDAQARRFERELDRLGRLWKQQDKGPTEFDPYPRKYKGD